MPIYEFRCNACGKRVSLFFRSMSTDATGVCDRCGSPDLSRLVSRVAIVRAPLDPSTLNKAELLDGVDYSNPASMAGFFRRMGDAFQDESNEHMDEIIGRLDHGEPVHEALDLDMHSHGEGGHTHDGGDAAGE
jgi:putative FmdB family regulatory protein